MGDLVKRGLRHQTARTDIQRGAHQLIGVHSRIDMLKAEHEEAMPMLDGVFGDLLTGAMSEVNWSEIAESMLAELPEEDDGDEEVA